MKIGTLSSEDEYKSDSRSDEYNDIDGAQKQLRAPNQDLS